MISNKPRWDQCVVGMYEDGSTINGFCGRNSFLSNFYESPLTRNGLTFNNLESAYQAAKYDDQPNIARYFSGVSADYAKKLSKSLPYDYITFERRKKRVMKELLYLKFLNPILRQRLRMTTPKNLIEYNWWNDAYWGTTVSGGRNVLGIMLMELRNSFA